MTEITIVFTTHRDAGECTPEALVKILECIGPEVFFEEMTELSFAELSRDSLRYTLEMRALRQYEMSWDVRRVRVDSATPTAQLVHEMNKIFDWVETDSISYVQSLALRQQRTRDFGFGYLVTDDFEQLSRVARDEMDRSVGESNSESLKSALASWNDIQREREGTMLANIIAHCRKHLFSRGAFLVGAEHRWSILNAINGFLDRDPNIIRWKVWDGVGEYGSGID